MWRVRKTSLTHGLENQGYELTEEVGFKQNADDQMVGKERRGCNERPQSKKMIISG